MNLLVIASNYPHSAHLFSGIFNQRSVDALRQHCDVVVLSPRPYIPFVLATQLKVARWEAHAATPSFEVRNGVPVHRPPYLQIPGLASAFWEDRSAYLSSSSIVKKLHTIHRFDAILSFGLGGAGTLAWRLSRALKIPAAGWATGSDLRKVKGTAAYRALERTLGRLDIIFYQSLELRELAGTIVPFSTTDKHIVLPRGICEPPALDKPNIRSRKRRELGIHENDILVLYTGRVVRSKGMFELLEALTLATSANPAIRCLIVGCKPGYDDSDALTKRIGKIPGLQSRINMLPGCDPDEVWQYLCAADIFAFPSHNEGMPNSLLEAMFVGLPAVAFAIPPIVELEANTGGVSLVPPLDSQRFAAAILRLAAFPEERTRIGMVARKCVLNRFMAHNNVREALAHLRRLTCRRDRHQQERSQLKTPSTEAHATLDPRR